MRSSLSRNESTLTIPAAQTCSFQEVVIKASSSGTSHVTTRTMAYPNEAYTATRTLFPIVYGLHHPPATVLSLTSYKVISSDGSYALSASWDKTLRLWELSTGVTTKRFVGHNNDVLSVSFSADNRQIVSGSRDRTIKLWNTLGDCKFTITEKGHTEWVSCVRFSPNPQNPVIVSAGWDKLVKVGSSSLRQSRGRAQREVIGCNATSSICYFRALRAMRQPITECTDDSQHAPPPSPPIETSPPKKKKREEANENLSHHRSGNSPPAASKPTTSGTPATSTP